MAPSKRSSSKKKKSRGMGVDFQKVKNKVGRKLKPPSNVTKIEVKSKAIILSGQSVALEKEGLAVNSRRQTLKELLMQTTHHNDNVRKEALLGIKDLLARHPDQLTLHTVTLIEKLCPRITDNDKSVRQVLLVLLRTSIFAGLPQVVMRPLLPVIMAYIFSAMTNLAIDIRLSAFTFLNALVQSYPSLVVAGYMDQIVQFHVDFLRKLGVLGQTGSQLRDILDGLLQFLAAVHVKVATKNVTTLVCTTEEQGHKENALSSDDERSMLIALHWYKSTKRQDILSPRLEGFSHQDQTVELPGSAQGSGSFSLKLVDALVQALLNCWAECAPLVCSGQAPDGDDIECMTKICQALHIVLLCIKPELEHVSYSDVNTRDAGTRLVNLYLNGKPSELQKWLQECAIPKFTHHLLASFPILAPSINLPKKVEETLIALNVAISEVMLDSVIAGGVRIQSQNQDLTTVLDYIEDAFHGKMLLSLGLSSSILDKRALESFIKSLIRFVPSILHCIIRERQTRLLEAFTEVFQNCKASSSLKHVCLTCIADILQPDHFLEVKIENMFLEADIFQFQKQWLQALPKLLWELKHNHVSSSLAVLQLLHHLGRSAPQGSLLAEEYTALQLLLIPFFSTRSASKHHQDRWMYGPFIKLPVKCQQLAIDLLYYFGKFSSSFLKAVTHCLCLELETNLIVRCVQVLHRAFCRGSISLSDHLSFLFTLIVQHNSFQGAANNITDSNDLGNGKTSGFQKHIVITGVVCSCICQIGDKRVMLDLLNRSICDQLVFPLCPIVSYGLLKVVAMLAGSREAFLLPESLSKILPPFIANYFYIAMEKGFQKIKVEDSFSMEQFVQPCFSLLSKSDKLTESVIYHLCKSSNGERGQHLFSTVSALLQIFQLEHVQKKISLTSEESFLSKQFGVDDFANLQHLEDKELKILFDKLSTAATSAYEWHLETTRNRI